MKKAAELSGKPQVLQWPTHLCNNLLPTVNLASTRSALGHLGGVTSFLGVAPDFSVLRSVTVASAVVMKKQVNPCADFSCST